MNINVDIGCVDNETSLSANVPNASSALSFLKMNDHEGSGVSATITLTDPDTVYRVLKLLRDNIK